MRTTRRRFLLEAFLLAALTQVAGCGRPAGVGKGLSAESRELDALREGLTLDVATEAGDKEGHTRLRVRLTNNSAKKILIGDAILVCASNMFRHATGGPQTAMTVKSDEESWRTERQQMFCTGADSLFGYMDGAMAHWLPGCSGQGVRIHNGVSCGTWPAVLEPHGEMAIHPTLWTEKQIEHAWVASPLLQTESGLGCRILRKVGLADTRPIFVPMTVSAISEAIGNTALPVPVRRWAAVWLVRLKVSDSRQEAIRILHSDDLPLDVRKGAVAAMAVYDAPTSLSAVDAVVWDMTAPEELRMCAFCALTWTDHPEAKPLTEKAVTHPDRSIREIAKSE